MIMLSLIGLVLLAIVYGLFFLVFKLIWILFKNKRNFWPLVLAGVTTVLLILLTVLACVNTYKNFVRPFTPIMEAMQNPKPVAPGTHLQATKDWSMRVANGVVFSDPIKWGNLTAYIGIDTKSLQQKNNASTEEPNFQLLAVIKYDADEPVSIQQVHQMTLNTIKQDGRIQTEAVSYSPDNQVLFVQGRAYAQKGAFNFLLLNTAQGDDIYYGLAFGTNELNALQGSLESFKLTKDTAAY